ncbi:MAG TPA: hypothetical protein VJG65_03045 [Patescibacteria group bacterium]|nr:hypothetical protein [Patescibacteria group bacterium]
MKKRNLKLIILAFLVIASFGFSYFALSAAPQEQVKTGLDVTAGQAGISDAGSEEPDLANILGLVVNYLFGVIGIVFLTFILIGGYLWMSATGNEDRIKKAKTFILNALFGLITVFMAYALVWLILNALKGATLK